MGCHTYCYVHIPGKEQEWENEYKESLIADCKFMIDDWKTMDNKLLQEYADQENESIKNALEVYESIKANGNIEEHIVYFGSKEEMEKYYDELSNKPLETAESIRERQIKFSEDTLKKLNDYDSIMDFIEGNFDNEEYDMFPRKFGLFIVYNHKIYRNTYACRGKGFMEDPVFEERFGDMFRIYDYEAKDCHSYEETMERCREYNIDWDATYPNCDVKVNNKERIKEFWETYPDGIITFG